MTPVIEFFTHCAQSGMPLIGRTKDTLLVASGRLVRVWRKVWEKGETDLHSHFIQWNQRERRRPRWQLGRKAKERT